MYKPLPTQISGALFLASNAHALLADDPRVGKTGAAIVGADMELAERILVITTASGRPVWERAFPQWSQFKRRVQVVSRERPLKNDTQVAIVGWGGVTRSDIAIPLLRQKWDLVIPDEAHYAKSFAAARTQALYGLPHDGGDWLMNKTALASGKRIWLLTGTPVPNAPNDLYPHLRALWPSRLKADPSKGWPDVTREADFTARYCVVRYKKISNFRKIPVVIGGRNLDELKARMDGIMLRRTQEDVGIRPPVYETFPLAVSEKQKREIDANVDLKVILDAAAAGDTRKLELELGPIRRLTGEIKARAVVDAVREEFECGLDKIVIAYWHKETGRILAEGLAKFGVGQIDGSTSATQRGALEQRFLTDKSMRVMLGQIQAAGEAVDFSSSASLLFAETSMIPAQMKQMSLRITNHTQKRQAFVRVAVLAGSIDEALETVLLRKWAAIRELV